MTRAYWHLVQLDSAGRPAWRMFPNFGALEWTDADRLMRHCLASGRRGVEVVRA